MTDRATIAAMLATAGLVLLVMMAGTGLAMNVFWQTPSLLLVLGGSVLATLVAFPVRRAQTLAGILRQAFSKPAGDTEEVVATVVVLSEAARRSGMLSLEEPVSRIEDRFLQRALRMAIDGLDAATIEEVMRSEMEGIDLRHTYGKGLLESMGRFAPVFGMIGTLIGLVVMLGQMNDPSRIGPGMAVALLTTLYGLVIANVFCLPLARKLAHQSSDELLLKTIALRGVLALQAGDHPRIVEQKMRAYLPEGQNDWTLAERMSAVRRALGLDGAAEGAEPVELDAAA